MSDKCDGCEDAHKKITHLEKRIGTLESFKKWAEPILNDIKLLRNDTRWMIIIALAFIGIVTWVYAYQIYPSFKQQNEDKLEIIKEIHKMEKVGYKGRQKLRSELIKKFNQSTKTINQHSTSASKINYSGIAKVIRKEVRRINE